MDLEGARLTSASLWQSTLVVVIIDAVVVGLLAWRIKPARFRQLMWPLAGVSIIFWTVMGVVMYQVFWDTYYRYFAPGWLHGWGIFAVMIPHGAVLALLFHWASQRLPGNPIVSFFLLAGIESWLEHLWGIFKFRILDIPMLQGVSPVSIFAFAFPEYILYWCVVIVIALLCQNGWRWWVGIRKKSKLTSR